MSVAYIFTFILRKILAKERLKGMFHTESSQTGSVDMDILPDSYPLLVYVSVFFGPFVQEDAAIFAAAGLAANSARETLPLFFTILVGVFFSDIWKYWIGWGALKHPRAKTYAEREQVMNMADKVQGNLLRTLLIGRFVPFARIPTYVACGYFKVSYLKFCLAIAFTAVLYIGAVFALVRVLGEVMGDQLKWVLPIAALIMLTVLGTFYGIKKRRAYAK